MEVHTVWGFPLTAYLAVCYGIGLICIGSILSFEINYYLANKILTVDPNKFSQDKFDNLKNKTHHALRRSIRSLLFFIFGFGLFLINLAGFAAAKISYSIFYQLETIILLFWGDGVLLLIRFIVLLVCQFILIIPFAQFQGGLWDSFRMVERLQETENAVPTNSETSQ